MRLRASASVKLLVPATGAAAVFDAALPLEIAGGAVEFEGALAAGPVIGRGGAVAAGGGGAVARDGDVPPELVCAAAAPAAPKASATATILIIERPDAR